MKRSVCLALTLSCLTLASLAQVPAFVESEKAAYRAYRQAVASSIGSSAASPDFTVSHYRLEWEVDPAVRFIRGRITAAFTVTAGTSSISFDMANELTVDSVLYHGNAISFSKPGNLTLTLAFPSPLPSNTRDSVTICYAGTPPTSGFGSFNTSTHAGVPCMWTLSEPFGSRDWWPCRNGLDDKADSIDVLVTTPDTYFASSNGLMQSNTTSGGKRTVWWKHRYPIATYLVSVSASNYVIQEDTIQLRDKTLPLQQYAYPESAANWASTIPSTRNIMRTFEDLIGPYPFRNERYAHTQTKIGGGMEHQTNSSMGFLEPGLISHELAHQWFGDKLTCASWSQIWLNEGFATFMNSIYFEKIRTRDAMVSFYRNQVNTVTKQKGGSVFVYDSTNANRIFDYNYTYLKGSWVLLMLRWKLGDSLFFRAVRNYLEDPALRYSFTKTEDLQRHLEAASGKDLGKFFQDWVYNQGWPSYQLNWLPLGSSRVQVVLNQTTSHSSVNFFELPVPILFRKGNKDSIVVMEHTSNGQSAVFEIGFIPDTVIIDPYVKLLSANNTVSRADLNAPTNGVKVFPNPVGSQFSILLTRFNDANAFVTIHNAAGQLMYKKELTLPAGNELLQVPSSLWSPGMYIIHVKSKGVDLMRSVLK